MTIINNQEIRNQYKNELSTLQMLYKSYMEVKCNWYKGKYTNKEEDAFCNAYFTLRDTIIKLPIIIPEDSKIKLEVLKDVLAYNVENNHGDYDLESGDGFEEEAFDLINQLLVA